MTKIFACLSLSTWDWDFFFGDTWDWDLVLLARHPNWVLFDCI